MIDQCTDVDMEAAVVGAGLDGSLDQSGNQILFGRFPMDVTVDGDADAAVVLSGENGAWKTLNYNLAQQMEPDARYHLVIAGYRFEVAIVDQDAYTADVWDLLRDSNGATGSY